MTQPTRIYCKVDWDKITSIEQLVSVFQAANLILPAAAANAPELSGLTHLVLPSGEPYTPLFKAGDQFVLEGRPVGLISNKEGKDYYIGNNGIPYYYCVKLEGEDVGVLEVEEHRLQDVPRYEKSEYSTTAAPPPSTLAEAIEFFLPRFDDFGETMSRNNLNSADTFAAFCHSQMSGGIGMQIRNELVLWDVSSPMSRYFINVQKVEQPDQMSAMILEGIYHRLKSRFFPQTTQDAQADGDQ